MKKRFKVVSALLIFTIISLLSACAVSADEKSPGTNDTKPEHNQVTEESYSITIVYDGNGAYTGTVPTDNQVYKLDYNGNYKSDDSNNIVIKGNSGNLELSGYKFEGWSTRDGKTYKPGDSVPVWQMRTPDMVQGNNEIWLYAKWSKEQYHLSFYYNHDDNSSCYLDRLVEYGEYITEPSGPTDWTPDYSVFGGWYTDKECSNSFDYNTPITGDIDFYAKWIKGSEIGGINADVIDFSLVKYDTTEYAYLSAPSGFDSYEWRINGEVQTETSNQLQFYKTGRKSGTYVVVVKAKKGDIYESATIFVKVEAR